MVQFLDSQTFCYFSCTEHWKKVNEDNFCQACGGVALKTKFDFKVELLIECSNKEKDVKTFLMFKRTAKMITSEENEESVETKLAEYQGQKCSVEHDDASDSDTIVIVKNLVINAYTLNKCKTFQMITVFLSHRKY